MYVVVWHANDGININTWLAGWLTGCMGGCECKLNANVFVVGLERNDVVMLLLSVCGCACVCGGDGCVGDTTNACTMYRVMGVWLWVSVWPAYRLYVL